ncbi:CCR4-NOT transcription complex subunit 10 isoform X2 [Cimex lectularius]|nr:CCR4-NOT transcription complex subunit 10 isoform X2 [Cimex lectularius]
MPRQQIIEKPKKSSNQKPQKEEENKPQNYLIAIKDGVRIMIDEQKLISSAYNEFINKKFAASLSSLNNLLLLKPNEAKVVHNKAVLELFISNHRNIDKYQQALQQICFHMNINTLESEVPDDLDHCVLYYNQAVVYFYQKEYDIALGIITKVFSLIQPMDSVLAFKVCLLLLELNLYCAQIEKALTNLSYIENQFLSTGFSGKLVKPDTDFTFQSAVISIEEFKSRLLNYKAKCLLVEKNYVECNKALDILYAGNAQNFFTIMTKAQVHFLNLEYEDALKTIIVIQEDVDNFQKLGNSRTLVFYNNIASIYHYSGKPYLSCFFMQKAFRLFKTTIEENQKSTKKEKIGPRDLFQPNVFPKIMYNSGLALLFAKKPIQAFDCLTEAVQVMHKSPLVWLRLAECCISLYKSGNEDIFNFMDKRKDIVASIATAGDLKRIVLNSSLYKDSAYSSEPQSYAVPLPTMEFATICANNAFILLSESDTKLKHAVLAALSYIHLTIGDPIKAHKYSMMLFEDQTISVIYKYLSRLYLSEALVMLNRLPEAIEILNPKNYKDLDLAPEVNKYSWIPKTQTTAQTVLIYNLAVVLAIRGDLKKSSEILKHVWINKGQKAEIPIHVIALALYIELVLGHNGVAQTMIKQNCPHAFLMK